MAQESYKNEYGVYSSSTKDSGFFIEDKDGVIYTDSNQLTKLELERISASQQPFVEKESYQIIFKIKSSETYWLLKNTGEISEIKFGNRND